MSQFVVRFSVTLTEIGQTFPLLIPVNAADVALRVLCRYEPEDTPPPPTVVVITVKDTPDPVPLPFVTRKFILVPEGSELPADFGKYIAAVPFGPDKVLVNVIEQLAINPTL
jgi:hypothetical protein